MTGKSYRNISGIEELDILLQNESAMLVYFSTAGCAVCKVLKPKVAALLDEYFPKMVHGVCRDNPNAPKLQPRTRFLLRQPLSYFFAGKRIPPEEP